MLRYNTTSARFGANALLAAFILLCVVTLNADSTSLDDLSDLSELEQMAISYPPYDNAKHQIKSELALIKNELSAVSKEKRPAKLNALAENTKWGTPERAAAYYVCAWYGVNYERCRDYLLNCVFWYDRGYYKHSKLAPYSWLDMGPELLYKLYEHNLDFRLLHDLMLGTGDASVATVLLACKTDALWKHPRGVLHVAEISPQGRDYVVRILARRTGEPNLDYWFDDDKEHGRVFEQYVNRVAADTKDPLQPLARGLLRDAKQ